MDTQTLNETPTAPTRWPPKGLQFEFRAGKGQPFMARWRNGGVKHSKSFLTAEDRDKFGREWLKTRKKKGVAVTIVTPAKAAIWAQFAELTGGADPITVARFWAKHHDTLGGAITIGDAIARYVEAQAGRKLTQDTITHRDLHLRRLMGSVGPKTKVGDVTTAQLREWLAALEMTPYSKKHHRANVDRFFSWLVAERLAEYNPCSNVPVPTNESNPINILTVDQTAHLFAVNHGHRSIGRLAMEAFAGLRFTSAARLTKEDIKADRHGIEMPAAKHKSGERQFIEDLPENVWQWIKHAPAAGWKLTWWAYRADKRAMFEAAGLKGDEEKDAASRNVLRHSFASYHVALHRDPGKTALILTHRNQQMLWRHYKGRASQADGKRYFEIAP